METIKAQKEQEVKSLLEKGESAREISESTGINLSFVYRVKVENNIGIPETIDQELINLLNKYKVSKKLAETIMGISANTLMKHGYKPLPN